MTTSSNRSLEKVLVPQVAAVVFTLAVFCVCRYFGVASGESAFITALFASVIFIIAALSTIVTAAHIAAIAISVAIAFMVSAAVFMIATAIFAVISSVPVSPVVSTYASVLVFSIAASIFLMVSTDGYGLPKFWLVASYVVELASISSSLFFMN